MSSLKFEEIVLAPKTMGQSYKAYTAAIYCHFRLNNISNLLTFYIKLPLYSYNVELTLEWQYITEVFRL